MRVTQVSVVIVEVPQVTPIAPYRSQYRSSSRTRSGIVQIETDDGLSGVGEFNVNFLEGLNPDQMQSQAQGWLLGRDALNIARFHAECPLESRLKSGLEMALWDIKGKVLGVSVAELLGGMLRTEISLAACMGIEEPHRAPDLAGYYVDQGFSTLKCKGGLGIAEDIAMIAAMRDAVGDRLKLRLDPNTAYSLAESIELAKRLEPYRLEYLEQPLPEKPLSDAARLRQATSTPIALNESVIDPASAFEILNAGAAGFLLPDTHLAGGIWPCVQIGMLCEAAGVPAIMHCGHDLGPKTAAMLHIASACPAYSLANDSTYYGLEDDILTERLSIHEGKMTVPKTPGLGTEVDSQKLARYQLEF
jgi:L-alanine-DL-glutamate epimerase-like enolase superfamily enzyme